MEVYPLSRWVMGAQIGCPNALKPRYFARNTFQSSFVSLAKV
jgi:hypothetical protein